MATERVILCGGASGANLPFQDADPVRLGPPDSAGSNVRLRIEDVRHGMTRDVPSQFLDLLDIATYVYVADQAVKRGSPKAVDLGASWRRRLYFRIPVREVDLWTGPAGGLLTQLLCFVSDEEYQFDFVPRQPGGGIQQYIDCGDPGEGNEFDEVMMFSGGLDSLAGAVDAAVVRGQRVLLVHHRSTEKRTPQHAELLERLRTRATHRPAHLTVHANKAKALNKEYTQRTRSFLYAALGATAAAMAGRDRFRFYENGVTGLNVPATEQVIGARASRTTHPKTLQAMNCLLTAVAGRPFRVESPFEWLTKAEVIRRIVDADCAELIALSSSCAHTWAQSKTRTHCGVCSQCIDRRFGVLAAGAEAHDPAAGYGADLLMGNWEDDQNRLLLLGYVGQARTISALSQDEFYSKYPEAVRALRHFGIGPVDAARRVFELHRRHAQGVRGVVEQAIRDHAGTILGDELPANCLVRMVLPTTPPSPAPPESLKEASPAPNLFRRKGEGWELRYHGGETLYFHRSKGLAYLHILVSNPGRRYAAEDLACLVDLDRPRYALTDAGERIDAEAHTNYQRRYDELRQARDEAQARGDVAAETDAREEMSALADELGLSLDHRGKLRRVGSQRARVQKAVGNAITRAVSKIRTYHSQLADHLESDVLVLGNSPGYTPPAGLTWEN